MSKSFHIAKAFWRLLLPLALCVVSLLGQWWFPPATIRWPLPFFGSNTYYSYLVVAIGILSAHFVITCLLALFWAFVFRGPIGRELQLEIVQSDLHPRVPMRRIGEFAIALARRRV